MLKAASGFSIVNNKLYLIFHRCLTAIHGGKFRTNHHLGTLQNILWFSRRQNGDKSHQVVSGACDFLRYYRMIKCIVALSKHD